MQSVLITEHSLVELKTMATAAFPCETGGILVGVKARRTVWIVSAIELVDERSPRHYTVPKGATRQAVMNAQETIDARVGYVGEWHSHVDNDGPSSADRAVMRLLAWFVPHPPPGGPCLVLVRGTAGDLTVHCYRARFPRLISVSLTATGPLPASDPTTPVFTSRRSSTKVGN